MINFSWTIIDGFFVLSQYFLKLILEPRIALRKTTMRISHTLLLHRQFLTMGDTNDLQIHREISELSANLLSTVHLIPFYPFFQILSIFGLPEKNNIIMACRNLNLLSYGVVDMGLDESEKEIKTRNIQALENISKYLGIRISYEQNDN